MVATDADGNAVLASNTAGLTIAGVARGIGGPGSHGVDARNRDIDVDNTGNPAGRNHVSVRAGIYRVMNSSASPVTSEDLGKVVYIEDERTVAHATSNNVVAGVVMGLAGTAHVWLCIGPVGTLPGSPSVGSV